MGSYNIEMEEYDLGVIEAGESDNNSREDTD